jgi:prepilin-type N-terminal cleavage/methylation domain-containing protein
MAQVLLMSFMMIFHKPHKASPLFRTGGFTLVETVVAIAVIGIGVVSTLGALTKFNSMADMSRNGTGVCAAALNQIDLIQSDGPFNPQKTNNDGTVQIPPELALGTQTKAVVVYQYKDVSNNNIVIVPGTMTTTVTDINPGTTTTYLYKAVVTVTYTYLNRSYSFSMSTVRTSDI